MISILSTVPCVYDLAYTYKPVPQIPWTEAMKNFTHLHSSMKTASLYIHIKYLNVAVILAIYVAS